MKLQWIVSGALVLALCTAALAQQAVLPDEYIAQPEPQIQGDIVLAVVGAHSGDLVSYGLPSIDAARMVAEKVNSAGGILGAKVRVVTFDDQCKPELAANAPARLKPEDVTVVLGHICSGATKAALPLWLDSKTVVMSPSATFPGLTQSGSFPNFFRTIASDDSQPKVAVEFAESLGLKRLAVIHDKGYYGKDFATQARQGIDAVAGLSVVLFEGVTPGAVDYSAVVNQIKSSGADGVLFGGYHPEAAKIVTQMRVKGLDIPFISDDGVKDDSFIKAAGQYAEGVYVTGPKDLSANRLYQQAVADFKTKYGKDPGPFFPEAYAAAQALLHAIESAGSTDYQAIRKALQSETVETPLGRIRFDARGECIGVGFSVYKVQNGKFGIVVK